MAKEWMRHDDPEDAIEAILEGADRAFAQLGVSKTGMNEIAAAAGCSRGTLYNHFSNRHDLHIAYVEKIAIEIRDLVERRTAVISDRDEKAVALISAALDEVRSRPGAMAWFAQGEVVRMKNSSEIQAILTQALFAANDRQDTSNENAFRDKWIIRVIVSLLSDPCESKEEEDLLLSKFVMPGLQ